MVVIILVKLIGFLENIVKWILFMIEKIIWEWYLKCFRFFKYINIIV